jgi:hypothetical protein
MEVSKSLELLVDLAELDDAGSLTLEKWKESVATISKIHPKRIICIKIDPMDKTVTWCPLDLEVELSGLVDLKMENPEDSVSLDISPSSHVLKRASEIPRGGMLRKSKMPPFGTILKWTDLDCMQGGLENNQYPGFQIAAPDNVQMSKTLMGKALLIKLAIFPTEFGTIHLFDNSTEDDFNFVSENIRWFTKEDAKKKQDEEYETQLRQLQMAQEHGLLGNTRILSTSHG